MDNMIAFGKILDHVLKGDDVSLGFLAAYKAFAADEDKKHPERPDYAALEYVFEEFMKSIHLKPIPINQYPYTVESAKIEMK